MKGFKSMTVKGDENMTTDRKEKTGKIGLEFIWGIRLKLWAEGDKLRAEGDKLRAEGSKLRAEGDKLWAEGILEACGNIKLEWKFNEEKSDYECHLENGEIFKP